MALNRQTVSQMENDMERWLKERERLSHKLERMRVKRRRLILEKGAGTKVVEDLDDQVMMSQGQDLESGFNVFRLQHFYSDSCRILLRLLSLS